MYTKLTDIENMQRIKENYLLYQNNYARNKDKITLSDLKKAIKQIKSYGFNVYEYYKGTLLNNCHEWLFTNPYYCKSSFCTVWNVLQFLVLKKLFKQGYRLTPIKKRYDWGYSWNYILKTN